jgi:hypothetical protein
MFRIARFEVLTAVLLNMQGFLDVTLHHLASIPDISEDHSDSVFRVNHSKQSRAATRLGLLDLEDEDAVSFETSGNYSPKDTA